MHGNRLSIGRVSESEVGIRSVPERTQYDSVDTPAYGGKVDIAQ